MRQYLYNLKTDSDERPIKPRAMAVHRRLHQSVFKHIVDGVDVNDEHVAISFSRELSGQEKNILDNLMEGPFEIWRKKRLRRPPAEEEVDFSMRPRDKQDIIDAVAAQIEVLREEVKASEVRLGEVLYGLRLGEPEPEHLLPIDDSIVDVDTAGKGSEIAAAPEAEELVLTEEVVDTKMAGELARLKELKSTKDGDSDE